MPRGIVIPHDLSVQPHEQTFENLASYQAAVGGYIEPVRMPRAKLLIYANEEGKVRSLPHNRRATALWWLHDPMMREQDELVGDVVLLGARGAAERDVPSDLADLILLTDEYRVEIQIADRSGWYLVDTMQSDYFAAAIQGLLHVRSDDVVKDVRIVAA